MNEDTHIEEMKHKRIEGAISELEMAIDRLGSLVTRATEKEPVERDEVAKQAPSSLEQFLVRTPERITRSVENIGCRFKELEEILF